jgi:SAM-dependent methyltransferase
LDSPGFGSGAMSNDFYHAFEGKYRGSRELIKARQTVYKPFIKSVKTNKENLRALDLGCGRGEWLELLGEWGIQAKGVDLDPVMLQDCTQRGLNVSQGNALSVLEELPPASIDIISGFHIAEHLKFSDLINLVKHAFRTLSPGGILILETPNSENINVATSSFYLDPTHRNPIPAPLFEFLFEHVGFKAVQVIRLNADFKKSSNPWISLYDVIGGVSRDYAVVGRVPVNEKDESNELIQLVQNHIGVSYEELVGRYDSQAHRVNEKIRELEIELVSLQSKVHRLETPIRVIKRSLEKLKNTGNLVTIIVYKLINTIKFGIRKFLLTIIKKLGLYPSIYRFYYRHRDQINYDSLSKDAKDVYADLKKEISQKKGSK